MLKSRPLQIENLEARQTMDAAVTAELVNGVLTITGTNDDDQITLSSVGNQLTVEQAAQTFKESKIKSIVIETGDGNDTVTVRLPARGSKWLNKDLTVEAGDGNDAFITTSGTRFYIGGEDDLLAVTKKGKVTIDGGLPDWFNSNVSVTELRETVRAAAVDSVLSRADMLEAFATVTPQDVVGQAAFDSLKKIVANAKFYTGVDYVRSLSSYIVDGAIPNAHYQGEALGNLTASSTGDDLQLLVNKWFLGLDHPDPADTVYSGTLEYVSVSGNLFVGDPNYTQIHQGNDGDCYFLSGMTSITVQNPQIIEDLFIVNGDNTWTLKFYNKGKAYYVTIDDMLPVKSNGEFPYADYHQRYDDPSNVLWAPFAEKAYCQFAEFGFLDTDGPKNNSYDAINGGYPYLVYEQILGVKANEVQFNRGPEPIIKAIAENRPVTFCTLQDPASSQVVPDHVYAVLGYDANSQKFHVFNPWGLHNGSQYPGTMELTFEEITQNYGWWAYGAVI